ncbi:MAG: FAD-binding oxidoreductase [Thermoprotei archaeon]
MVDNDEFINELKYRLGEKVSSDSVDLLLHNRDATLIEGTAIAVVMPTSVYEVSEVMKICYKYAVPVCPQGSLTSLTGASVPQGGIALDLSKMNKIIEVHPLDGYVVVEAGVKIEELNEYLKSYGMFFPIDPASAKSATVGGAIATNAGGMRGFRFGTMANWVLGLEVVLSDGKIIRIGGKTLKRRQGYNLVGLFIGSEGTLGIITKAILKITKLPEGIVRIIATFPSYKEVSKAALELRKNFNPLIIEFIDSELASIISQYTDVKIPIKPGFIMIVDIDGPPDSLPQKANEVVELFKNLGAVDVKWSMDPKEMEKFYELRRALYSAELNLRSIYSLNMILEDLIVPPTRVSEFIEKIHELSKSMGLKVALGGHLGDGNIHPSIYYSNSEKAKIKEFHEEVCKLAIELGGGISAEHGIGLTKIDALKFELEMLGSEYALDIMRNIKKLFDPRNILNPRKMIILKEAVNSDE